MNREKTAWIVSLILIALLAFQIPGTLAQRDDDYVFVRRLVDIHRQVASNYVDAVEAERLQQGAIDGMLEQLDPFSVYVPPEKQEQFDRMLDGTFKGVGIQLNQLPNGQVEVVTPIDGSPAFKAGVQAGDIILKVNGESIDGLRLEAVVKKIAGKLATPVTLRLRHVTGEEVGLTMNREEIQIPSLKGYQRKQDNGWDYYVSEQPKIAYVRITQFTPDTADNLRSILTPLLAEGMKGLILDLRLNPGGRLEEAVTMVDMFVHEGVIVSTKGRNRPERIWTASGKNTLPWFPMIVLVNEHSASASEIVAGSLMDNRRAVVVGERTYGKGSVQELVRLEGDGELKLTVAHYYLPSGRLVHRKKEAQDWGVDPQIPVPVDPAVEVGIFKARYEQELFRRPMLKSTTGPATQPVATTQPSSQPVDLQLQRAVEVMTGMVFGQPWNGASPTTRPEVAAVVSPPTTTTAPAEIPDEP